jgi:hypothetical protein
MSKRGRSQNRARDAQRQAPEVTSRGPAERPGRRSTHPVGTGSEGATSDPEPLLQALRRQVRANARSARRRDELVLQARAAGATWTAIAGVLGVSPQAAQQRYASGVSSDG